MTVVLSAVGRSTWRLSPGLIRWAIEWTVGRRKWIAGRTRTQVFARPDFRDQVVVRALSMFDTRVPISCPITS